MNQEQLARQMNGVVYAQRKLAYLQEKLGELLAHDPITLEPGQQVLSAANVETAATHEHLIKEARTAIADEESTVQQTTDLLLQSLPEIIKELIRKGMPLVAHWKTDGIEPLALIYELDKFSIIPDNKKG